MRGWKGWKQNSWKGWGAFIVAIASKVGNIAVAMPRKFFSARRSKTTR